MSIPINLHPQLRPSALSFPRHNNLEWLRLIFATQVVAEHAAEHLGMRIPEIFGRFPGVPAFFFVSGFLIYASYLNAPGKRYFENRFLRLFPALALVTMGGAFVALVAHGGGDLRDNFKVYALWALAQTTLGQAYNPALFRDVGVGVMNGALWTLTTEILFYLAVPPLVRAERAFRFVLPVLIAVSYAVYVIGPSLLDQRIYRDKTAYDVIALTPIAWGWMFGIGILAVKHFGMVSRGLRYFPWAAIPIALMIHLGEGPVFGSAGNRLGIAYFVCYVCLVLWFAFATPFVKLKTDLSYGTYIWHLPVINFLLVLGTPNVPLAFLLTFAMATLSWFLVEKPALKLKHRSLRPVDDTAKA